MKSVFVSGKVERRIENLKLSGKAGSALAQKAVLIIERITSGALQEPFDPGGSVTRHGEKRIRHCRKYDLGRGYRMILLLRGTKAYVTFLGTHDECQRWLEKNSRLREVVAGKGSVFYLDAPEPSEPEPELDPESPDPETDFGDDPEPMVRDRDLRLVFRGLIEGARRASS